MGPQDNRHPLALAVVLCAPLICAAAPDAPSLAEAVDGLEGSHDEGVEAVRVLSAGGEGAVAQLRVAWSRLTQRAQRRAVRALEALARNESSAVELLVEAARSPIEPVREDALDALSRTGAQGARGLVELLRDEVAGDRAAMRLARGQPASAVQPLLEVMAGEGGPERPGLRDALRTAALRGGPEARQVLDGWLVSEPTPAALAAAAVALSGAPAFGPLVTRWTASGAPKSDDFATAWRFAQSARGSGPNDAIDAWLREQLQTADKWMLRGAAVEALAMRDRLPMIRSALKDPSPRVRFLAAQALAGDPDSVLARAKLARRDRWPMVRAAAVMSLRDQPEVTPVVVAAVDDPMSEVRVAAIEVLKSAPHLQGWERIQGRLKSKDERPPVTAAAIEYVVAHCPADASDALVDVILRSAGRKAGPDDLNNAVRAIRALRGLQTPEGEAALKRLGRAPGLPPALALALEEPRAKLPSCARKKG